jgi:hypothetical protein
MNGTTWESSKNGLRMIEAVAEHLSPRKWTLIACQMLRQFHAFSVETLCPTLELIERNADGFKIAAPTSSITPSQAGERQLKIVEHLDPRTSTENTRWMEQHQTKMPTAILHYNASAAAQESIIAAEQSCELLLEAMTCTMLLSIDGVIDSFAHFGENLRNAEVSRLEVAHCTRLALRYSARAEELQQQIPARNARLIRANAEDYIDSTELKFYGLEERTRRNVTRWFQKLLAGSLREQLGNPYRKQNIPAECRTETVLALARGISMERAFDRLPILADALEEAGCQDMSLLTHARSSMNHFAGCWVVDRILHPEEQVFQQSIKPTRRALGRSEQMGRYQAPPEGMA